MQKDFALAVLWVESAGVGGDGGVAAVDRSAGGTAEDHPDRAAKPEEQSHLGGRAGRGQDRDLEVKAETLRF